MTDKEIILLKPSNAQFENLEHFESREISKEMISAIVRLTKSEVITEFETKLTMHFGTYTDKDYLRVLDMVRLIDQIAKEMKEGVNNA